MEDTRTDADRFLAAVAEHTEGLEGVAIGCAGRLCEYADGTDDVEHSCDPSFSWAACEGCGSHLGGDRLPAFGHYRDAAGEVQAIEMSVCVDCAMLHANGETPDVWK